ncbi:MAG: transglycosylase domain-containing protein [Candidatus Dormibacteria bacterium]
MIRDPFESDWDRARTIAAHGAARLRRSLAARGRPMRLLALLAVGGLAAMVLLAVPFTALADSYSSLPAVARTFPANTLVYAQGGQQIADLHAQGESRVPVSLGQVAPVMQQAVVAIEDHGYWTSPSFDLARIVKAAFYDVAHRAPVQGASTIEEQLAKILYLQDNKSLIYKIKEIVYGNDLTAHYSRRQILQQYLNDVYFGQGATGVQAAAQIYFGVPASRLDTAQATMLAGLLPAPSALDPFVNPNAARQRQRLVVAAMVAQGELSKSQAAAVLAKPTPLRQTAPANLAPYFLDQVEQWLQARFGSSYQSKGLRVYTTLNLPLNERAQQLVSQVISARSAMHMSDGALVAENPQNGNIETWVGGAGPKVPGGQIDMAAVPRQTGSTFKVFTYSAAIATRTVTMTTPILDNQLTLPSGGPNGTPYVIHDYNGQYFGVVPAEVALGNSLNVPAVRVELATGIPRVLSLARSFGVTTLNHPDSTYGPSLTLGAYPIPLWEMAQAGSVLAAQGTLHPARFILSVKSQSGSALYSAPATSHTVMSSSAAFIMNTILSRNSNRQLAFGPNTPLVIPGRRVAVKTGTSNSFRDNLAVGWTPGLVGAVWVGNANDSPMYGGGINGISGAAILWHDFMEAALQGQPATWYQPPAGLTSAQYQGQTVYYLAGTGPSYQVLGGGTTGGGPPGQGGPPGKGADHKHKGHGH